MSEFQPTSGGGSAASSKIWVVLSGIVGVLLVVAIALGAGYYWGSTSKEQVMTAEKQVLATETALIMQATAQALPPAGADKDFQTFWEVWNLVNKEFYHTEPIDEKQMMYGAIRGMLQSLGDDFTGFQEPEAAERSREDMRGNFEGIGAYVEYKEGQILIVSPIEGSPAEKANVRAGDIVVAVDGKQISEVIADLERDQALSEAIKLIRGPKGSQVVITVYRTSEEKQIDITIVRDTIPLISVRSTMIGDIGYIQLSEFKQTSYDELDQAIAKLKPNNPKAIIFDLRNNPGGYVTQAQNILGRFTKDGVTHYQENSNGVQKEYRTLQQGTPQELFDIPVVVLVNGGSASASEIVSGAMQDTKRATLIGEKTFGKGSVQSVHTLTDKSEARITVAHWLTPNKRAIHTLGITPDYVVPFSDDAAQYPVECILNRTPADGATSCADSQLFWALKFLNEQQTPPPPPTPTITPTPGK